MRPGRDFPPGGRSGPAGFRIRSFLNRAAQALGLPRNTIRPFVVLFLLIMTLGIFARVWQFGSLPPGLHPDEASTALEAYDLVHFGMDRNGFSFPLQFVSWGSGMNALVYAYILIPFIAIGGLSPTLTRLPMLISGILILPLAFFAARQTLGRRPALLATFFIAISPWHIMQSRWGHDANFLPFVFLVAYCCLLRSRANNRWFILASVLFGMCLYVYGPAYAAVPAFLAVAIPVMLRSGRVSRQSLALGLLAFASLAIPLGFLLLFNALRLDTIQLGALTVPRLPSQPRYETMSMALHAGFLPGLIQNLWSTLVILTIQVDGVWTTIVPYGYFYTLTFPLAVLGGLALLRKPGKTPEQLLLLGWVAAALVVGGLVRSNFNHLNLVFTPLILCIASCLAWIRKRARALPALIVYVLVIAFLAFTRDYHSDVYRLRVGREFFSAGLLPAIDFARHSPGSPICITDAVNMPYIYVLFTERMDPADYLNDIEYVDPTEPFRKVRSLGRYSFGLQNCSDDRATIYILSEEQPPRQDVNYTVSQFETFRVYAP